MAKGLLKNYTSVFSKLQGQALAPSLAALVAFAFNGLDLTGWPLFIPAAILLIGIGYMVYISVLAYKSLYPYTKVPYSICIGKSRDEFEAAIVLQERKVDNLGIAWGSVQSIKRLHRNDWTYHNPGTLGDDKDTWIRIAADTVSHFAAFARRLEHPAIFHIFLMAPPSLAFVLGAQVGRHRPCVVYQYAGAVSDPYRSVLDSSKKSDVEAFHAKTARISLNAAEEIAVEISEGSSRSGCVIIINMTSHDVPRPTPEESVSADADVTVITIRSKIPDGHIPLSNDWERLGREISSVVLDRAGQFSTVYVYMNAPLALAFIIGATLGEPANVTLCEFNAYLKRHVQTMPLGISILHAEKQRRMGQ